MGRERRKERKEKVEVEGEGGTYMYGANCWHIQTAKGNAHRVWKGQRLGQEKSVVHRALSKGDGLGVACSSFSGERTRRPVQSE